MISNLKKRFYTSLILFFLIFSIFNYNFILIYFLIILGVLSVLEFLEMTKKLSINRLINILLNIFFIFYIFIFSCSFFIFANLAGIKVLLLILLLACVSSDIGGFIFGKIFKGPKLTKISPNKTYAGSLGSIIFSIGTVLISFYYLNLTINFQIIIIATMTSIFCQLGDLIFSYLKRKIKIQDTGKILPGHGGLLDRLDGILLGLPLGFLIFILLY